MLNFYSSPSLQVLQHWSAGKVGSSAQKSAWNNFSKFCINPISTGSQFERCVIVRILFFFDERWFIYPSHSTSPEKTGTLLRPLRCRVVCLFPVSPPRDAWRHPYVTSIIQNVGESPPSLLLGSLLALHEFGVGLVVALSNNILFEFCIASAPAPNIHKSNTSLLPIIITNSKLVFYRDGFSTLSDDINYDSTISCIFGLAVGCDWSLKHKTHKGRSVIISGEQGW